MKTIRFLLAICLLLILTGLPVYAGNGTLRINGEVRPQNIVRHKTYSYRSSTVTTGPIRQYRTYYGYPCGHRYRPCRRRYCNPPYRINRPGVTIRIPIR